MTFTSTPVRAMAGSSDLRAGVGLRFPHHAEIKAERPAIGWLEVHAENYMGGGLAAADLADLRSDYPISLHAVGLSLGSANGVSDRHLERLRRLVTQTQPVLVSDHLSWSDAGGSYLADLLPLPLTEEALAVVSRNIDRVQTVLRRPILIENPSTYLAFADDAIPEPEFLNTLASRTGCGLLCDVNNIYVSAYNNAAFDPYAHIDALDIACIGEIHLAGHTQAVLAAEADQPAASVLLDDHGSPVCDPVWALYDHLIARTGRRPTLIEWDRNIPPLASLLAEAAKVERRLSVREAIHADAG